LHQSVDRKEMTKFNYYQEDKGNYGGCKTKKEGGKRLHQKKTLQTINPLKGRKGKEGGGAT